MHVRSWIVATCPEGGALKLSSFAAHAAFPSLLFVATPFTFVAAQVSGAAGAGASFQRNGDGWHSVTRFEPAFRLDNQWLGLRGDLSAIAGPSGVRADESALALSAAPPAIGAFRLTTRSTFDNVAIAPGVTRRLTTFESAIGVARDGRGAWVGAAIERSTMLDSAPARPVLRLGFWQQWRALTFSIGSESHAVKVGGRPSTFRTTFIHDSLYDSTSHTYQPTLTPRIFGDSGAPSRALQWSDVEARLGGSFARVSFDARLGYRPTLDGARATLWGKANATTELTGRLSLVASLGSEAARLWVGAPAARFVALGLKVAPAALVRPAAPPHVRPVASSLQVARAEGGGYQLTLHVPDARVVELSGDFNRWQPVALRQTLPDVWETTLAIAPGTYRVSVRVNGDRWVAPPGLVTIADDFNGTVGLLILH
jgi:hypothetical protein